MLGLMQSLTRNKFTGGILFGLVILSMAVWGIEDIFSGNFGQNIIQAGERGVSEQQLGRKFENYLNNVRREQPGNAISRQEATEQGILDQIYGVEQSRIVNLGYARSLGADASPQALLEDVRSIPAFQNPLTNEFDPQYYRNALLRSNISVSEFEDDTQDRLTLDYLRDGIAAATVAPTDLARVQAAFDGEVRYISWLPIEQTALPPLEDPTDEELQTFYDGQTAAFETPERRVLSMLSVSADNFIDQAEISEEDITSYYEATKNRRLATPEQRTFLEAVFADEDSAKAAFGILAVGGSLDETEDVTITTRTSVIDDVAIPEFRDSLFRPGAAAGSVAGPFETSSGWIVGRLIEVLPGTPKTLEETREEITGELAAQEAEIAYYTALNDFDDLIGQGLGLEEVGERFGAEVQTFEPVDARGVTAQAAFVEELTKSPQAFQQAFELPLGTITDRFDNDASTVIISIDEVIEKSTPPLSENLDRAKTAYRIVREGEALKAAVDAAKVSLDDGSATMETLAETYNSVVETPERGLRRTAFDNTLPRPVLQAAFTLEEGASQVVQGRAPAELILVKINNIDRPLATELDVLAPISAPKIAEQLNQDILFAFEKEVQNSLEIKTNDAAFAAYKARLLQDQ